MVSQPALIVNPVFRGSKSQRIDLEYFHDDTDWLIGE